MEARMEGERCHCENGRCDFRGSSHFFDHESGQYGSCNNLAGDTYIRDIGYVCDECAARYDKEYHLTEADDFEEIREPDDDDTVHFCPECERPNQFGELCGHCRREIEAERAYV